MSSLAAAALSQPSPVRQGGGKPMPQDTVPARIVPGAKTTRSREVVQPPKGSKPALLAPGEIVNDQQTSAAVIGPMLEEFEKTGLVDGKRPGPRVLQFLKSLLPQGEAGEQDAGEDGEAYGCGGKVVGFVEGGLIPKLANTTAQHYGYQDFNAAKEALTPDVKSTLMGLNAQAKRVLPIEQTMPTNAQSSPKPPATPAQNTLLMGAGTVKAPAPTSPQPTTNPAPANTGDEEAHGVYNFGNGSGIRLNSPEQNHAFANNGGPFAGGDPTLTMGEALHNAAANQRNPNIFTAENGGYASGQIGKGGTVSVLGGGAVPGGKPTLSQAANALNGGSIRFSDPQIERPSQWAMEIATHNAAVDANSHSGRGPWKERLAALKGQAAAADAQALQRQQLAAGLQGQSLQSQAATALGMAQLGEQQRAAQVKEGLLAKAAAGDKNALMALHGTGRTSSKGFSLKSIPDMQAKPPMVNGKPDPMWQRPMVGARQNNDTGEIQLIRDGAGGNQPKQPLRYEGLEHAFISKPDKNGVRYPVYNELDENGKVKMVGGKPVQHIDYDQPF